MVDWKLRPLLDKNPEIVHSFDYKWYNHALFRDFLIFTKMIFIKVKVFNKCYCL